MPIGGPERPRGPKNVNETFKWASTYLGRLCHHFGRAKVLNKLQKWRWNFTTSFSGIGCAETALYLELEFPPLEFKKVCGPKAVLSVQGAVSEAVPLHWAPRVRTMWACENNSHCQEVLANTYGDSCLFGDIMEFDLPAKTELFCLKHKTMCQCTVPREKNRNSS